MIYGKKDCPHTQRAVADFKKQVRSFLFIDVESNPKGMEQLLQYTDGKYMVPVIVNVDEGNVEIGYTGD